MKKPLTIFASVVLFLVFGFYVPHAISRSSPNYLGTFGVTAYDTDVVDDLDEQRQLISGLVESIGSEIKFWLLARGFIFRSTVVKIEDTTVNTREMIVGRPKYYWTLKNYSLFNIPVGTQRFYRIPDA